MIDLTKDWQSQKEALEVAGVHLPLKNPNPSEKIKWLHFGGGNLFRAFHAQLAQSLVDSDELPGGVGVVETFDEEIIEKAYRPFKNQILQVVLQEDGDLKRNLFTATSLALKGSPDQPDFQKLIALFQSEALQFCTFTITEKGYNLTDSKNQFLPIILTDIEKGPEKAEHTISLITRLLWERFKNGAYPIAMITTDNFSHNGAKFSESVWAIAKEWEKNGFVTPKFMAYLTDESQVSFPWSMIDRITPNPALSIFQQLRKDGFEKMDLIHTEKGTNVAGFVNTEMTHYLVIEDKFPNGRPDLTKAGIFLTDQATVDRADTMKLTTCLNPLQTALAVTGVVLGYDKVSEEMKDPDLVNLVKRVGYDEGFPVVVDPGIISPKKFIDEVVEKRLPNPYIPDVPQRTATDTSQKVAIRYGETIKKYLKKGTTEKLQIIPLVQACWLRYLLAVDDQGHSFVPSSDPLLAELQSQLEPFYLGYEGEVHTALVPILSNAKIFGVNLYEAGLGEKVENYFKELITGPQAVRKTLHKYVGK